MVHELRDAGAHWIAEPADRPLGRFATFADHPNGNYLLIIEFTDHP